MIPEVDADILKQVTRDDLSKAPDCFFVEVMPAETEADWLRAVEAELVNVYGGRTPDWLEFKMGPRVSWNGHAFCSMRCWAGRVHAQLMMAAEHRELSRGVAVLGTRMRDHQLLCTVWVDGQKTEFDGKGIAGQLPRAEADGPRGGNWLDMR